MDEYLLWLLTAPILLPEDVHAALSLLGQTEPDEEDEE